MLLLQLLLSCRRLGRVRRCPLQRGTCILQQALSWDTFIPGNNKRGTSCLLQKPITCRHFIDSYFMAASSAASTGTCSAITSHQPCKLKLTAGCIPSLGRICMPCSALRAELRGLDRLQFGRRDPCSPETRSQLSCSYAAHNSDKYAPYAPRGCLPACFSLIMIAVSAPSLFRMSIQECSRCCRSPRPHETLSPKENRVTTAVEAMRSEPVSRCAHGHAPARQLQTISAR